MKKISCLFFSFFLALSVKVTAGTVTIIFNEVSIIDCEFTFIPYCYGDQEKCEITYFNSNGRWERYYCKVPFPEFLFHEKITEATLSVFKIRDSLSETGQSFSLAVNRLTEPMTEFYERTPGDNITPPAHDILNIYAVSDTFAGDFEGRIDLKIDTLVQGWLNEEYANNGFLIRMFNEGNPGFSQRIIICQSSFENEEKRPILKITGPELPDTLIRVLPTPVRFKSDDYEQSYFLAQNYPNPFNPYTTIEYTVLHKSYVSLAVYDLLGRKVTDLVNEVKSAGSYKIRFNGYRISSGVYLYKLTVKPADRNTIVSSKIKKLILVK